jgi:hypothetical protein
MTNRKIESRIAEEFNGLEEVEAMLLGGSRAAHNLDKDSDYDFYVYLIKEIDPAIREYIANRLADYYEINNQFWESGDEWTLRENGTGIDIMYRSFDWLKGEVNRNIVDHQANVGYSTCLWFNILNSEILFDKSGRLTHFQEQAAIPYPEPLKINVIRKNYPVIRQIRSSYKHQIELAVKRADRVSINHRVAAVLASYFDILFAVNEQPHPGEKRQMQCLMKNADKLPVNMESAVNALLMNCSTPDIKILNSIDELMEGLDELLRNENLLQ